MPYRPDNEVRLKVRPEEETVWLTQAQIVELFPSGKANISEHIKNIYEQEEWEESATVRKSRTVRQKGKRQVVRTLTYYNLDAIISIGFRVNSKRGIQFRQWANKVRRAEAQQPISSDRHPHLQEVSRPLPDYRRSGGLSHRSLPERPWQKDVRLLPVRDTRYRHHGFAVRQGEPSRHVPLKQPSVAAGPHLRRSPTASPRPLRLGGPGAGMQMGGRRRPRVRVPPRRHRRRGLREPRRGGRPRWGWHG